MQAIVYNVHQKIGRCNLLLLVGGFGGGGIMWCLDTVTEIRLTQKASFSSNLVLQNLRLIDNHLFIPQPGRGRNEVHIRWYPPPHGWTLLNTDGASKGNPGPAGSGGLFCDETGNFIEAFYFSSGFCSTMRSELLALETGLQHARSLRISKLLVNMDNSPCIQLVLEDQLVSNSLRSIVNNCKELIRDTTWKVELKHCYREANRAADWLANVGVQSSIEKTVIDSPPVELRSILREDILGVALPRVIVSQ